jgi:hypothetical protein
MPPLLPPGRAAISLVTSFAVFFCDPAAIGLQRVEAADAAAAELQGCVAQKYRR